MDEPKAPPKMVAVVVPICNRSEFTPDEQISLRHLQCYLEKYDKYLIAPKSLEIDYPGFLIKRFSDRFFGSSLAHKKLIFASQFYRAFGEYKYILYYQLDALVFSDQLQEWCDTDLDYIGAPWIRHKDAPYHGSPYWEGKVGNGGFSLRKISSFLKVLNSHQYSLDPALYGETSSDNHSEPIRWVVRAKQLLKHCKWFNGIRWELSRTRRPDDGFWANRANHYYPAFKVASVETALRFSFECVPRYCFKLTNQTLPFGCHAWDRYDREFWEPYLLR